MLPWTKPGAAQREPSSNPPTEPPAPPEVAAEPAAILAAPSAQSRADALTRWLAGEPQQSEVEQLLQALQDRDRGAARLLREHLSRISSQHRQHDALQALAERAQSLAEKPALSSQDAVELDAALQGLPADAWPPALSTAREHITARLHAQTELQQHLRDAVTALTDFRAALRVAGAGPLQAALAANDSTAERWAQLQLSVQTLGHDAEWPAMPPRLRAQWQAACAETQAAWEQYAADLGRAAAAMAEPTAELPTHRHWAAEIQALRVPAPPVKPTAAPAESASAAAPTRPTAREGDANQVAEAKLTIDFLERALAEGHLKAAQRHADKLRTILGAHGGLPSSLVSRVQAAVAQTQQLAEWQRWRTDQLREELCVRAEALRDHALAPRAQAEALRQLREEWKALDQTGAANGVLWQRFDAACNAAHAPVEVFVAQEREQLAQAEAARRALVAELQQWRAVQAEQMQAADAQPDWRAIGHALDGFADRWRHGGHLPEKRFAKLQADWRAAFDAAAAPLKAAQAQARQQRDALIARAEQICASDAPNISEQLRGLMLQWQAEAKAFALPRPLEQKLWERFRKPQDAWHEGRKKAFEAHQAERHAHEQAVRDALAALDAAGDEPAIRSAWQAMERLWDETFAPRRGPGPRAVPPRVPNDLIALRRRVEEQARKRLNALHEGRRGHALDALLAAWAARDAAQLPSADAWSKPITKAVLQQWAAALQKTPQGEAGPSLLRLELASETDSPPTEQAARRALQLSLLASRGRDALMTQWPEDVTKVLAATHDAGQAARLKRCLMRLVR